MPAWSWQVRKAAERAMVVLAAVVGAADLVRTKPAVETLNKPRQAWLVNAHQVTLTGIQPNFYP
ncbi:MAG: hypothetical protein O2967_12465 [Proteobacteria bacterium]|nr:hypothetical protein [Pseudomonadota bacterium]